MLNTYAKSVHRNQLFAYEIGLKKNRFFVVNGARGQRHKNVLYIRAQGVQKLLKFTYIL